MKKLISGLILAVVVTPVLAENEVDQQGTAASTLTTSSYTLEVKEGEKTLSMLDFAAVDYQKTRVENWHLESEPSDNIHSYEVTTGFGMTLHPAKNSDFMHISFEYRQPVNQKKQEHVYRVETGVILAKGESFCTDLSGTGEKMEFCLSRI